MSSAVGSEHLPGLRARLAGHWWSVGATARGVLLPPLGPPARRWTTSVDDPTVGPVRLTGLLHHVGGSRTLVLIVHGLGGEVTSGYCVAMAAAACRAGLSSLRLGLRGGDRSGEDVYHAGLTADVAAALQSEALAQYEHILLCGFSLGGHVCLCAAVQKLDPRLRAVAAIGPPFDLGAVQRAIDEPGRWPYRTYLLMSLKRMYRALAQRRPVPTPVPEVLCAPTLRQYDALVVVPRFGFRDVDDYYDSCSVGPQLGELEIPSLVVASTRDPIVPAATLRSGAEAASAALQMCCFDAGGHIYFPDSIRIAGAPGADGVWLPDTRLETQVLGWLEQRRLSWCRIIDAG